MEPVFKFSKLKQLDPYLFAEVEVRLGNETDAIGYCSIRLTVPVANRDQSLTALREQSLALARSSISVPALLAWMEEQRAAQ